jgi:hypothetical protein
MVLIRFSSLQAKRAALGYLPGRFPFKSWSTGEMIVPELALIGMAAEGIHFAVDGIATYQHLIAGATNPSDTDAY